MPARFILETPQNPLLYYYIFVYSRAAPILYYYISVSPRAATILGSPALYYYIFVSSRAATNFGVAPVALPHFCFFARRDEFLSGFLQLTEDGYAGAIHSQNRSDRKSAVRGDLVAMGFGDFLNQAVGAQESKLAADRR
jgi:hypothetical protein